MANELRERTHVGGAVVVSAAFVLTAGAILGGCIALAALVGDRLDDALVGTPRVDTEPRTRLRAVDAVDLEPLAYGDLVAVTDPYGTVHVVDATNGADRWQGPQPPSTPPAVVADTNSVRATDTSATVRWTVPFPYGVLRLVPAGPVVGVTSFDVAASSTAGAPGAAPSLTSTVFVDAATGQERWRTPSGALSSFAYRDGIVFEYGEGRALVARDAFTGAVRWTVARPYGRLLASGGAIWVGDDSRLDSYDAATGLLRSQVAISAHEPQPVAVAGSTVVLAE